MFLEIATNHRPATDLGYLLHKNPSRAHELELAFGRAHMVYTQASEDRCAFSMLLDIDPALASLRDQTAARLDRASRSRHTYARPVSGIHDCRIAPFHLLASEGAVHMDKDHLWHMAALGRLATAGDPLVMATAHHLVDPADATQVAEAVRGWEDLTVRRGEGIVVKPHEFLIRGSKGLVQPAVKCRGSEYLRIIYGPDYDAPEHLDRLRLRGVGRKHSLALRELLLGQEALHPFVAREALRRVHEAVYGILALESEPVDPRLSGQRPITASDLRWPLPGGRKSPCPPPLPTS